MALMFSDVTFPKCPTFTHPVSSCHFVVVQALDDQKCGDQARDSAHDVLLT